MSVLTINRKIKAAQKDLERLISMRDAEQEAEVSATPAQRLAIYLHEATCRLNHMDQCGWAYEIRDGLHDWERPSHATMLRRADAIIDRFGYEQGVNIIDSGLFQ